MIGSETSKFNINIYIIQIVYIPPTELKHHTHISNGVKNATVSTMCNLKVNCREIDVGNQRRFFQRNCKDLASFVHSICVAWIAKQFHITYNTFVFKKHK